jgi:hypothetical protein
MFGFRVDYRAQGGSPRSVTILHLFSVLAPGRRAAFGDNPPPFSHPSAGRQAAFSNNLAPLSKSRRRSEFECRNGSLILFKTRADPPSGSRPLRRARALRSVIDWCPSVVGEQFRKEIDASGSVSQTKKGEPGSAPPLASTCVNELSTFL